MENGGNTQYQGFRVKKLALWLKSEVAHLSYWRGMRPRRQQLKCASTTTKRSNHSSTSCTHWMFELFQYTACRSLALVSCRFVSASVRRLRENLARAIIPAVRLRLPQLRLSASPLRLSRTAASLTTSSKSTHTHTVTVTSFTHGWSRYRLISLRVLQLKSHCDETPFGHLHLCQTCAHFESCSCESVGWVCSHQRDGESDDKATEDIPHSRLKSWGRALQLWISEEKLLRTCSSSSSGGRTLRTQRYKHALWWRRDALSCPSAPWPRPPADSTKECV